MRSFARFRHRTNIEVLPLAELLPARGAVPEADATGSFSPGWYGVARNAAVPVSGAVVANDWTVLEFDHTSGCRVRSEDVTLEDWDESLSSEEEPNSLVKLAKAPLSGELVDPVQAFFRQPDEAGFWERITTDYVDDTARLVYADWLDEHDDPYAWVFREPMPFVRGYQRLSWLGAVSSVNSRHFGWESESNLSGLHTGRARTVPMTLCNRQTVPPFIGYLLGVTRFRSNRRISDRDREEFFFRQRLKSARRLGFWLQGDLLVGPNEKPVCRVVNPTDTIAVLGELTAHDSARALEGVIARLRRVNGAVEVNELGRAEWTPPAGLENWKHLPQAALDLFTKLGNGRILRRILAEAQEQAERTRAPLSVLALNVDGLHQINRDYTQLAGDWILLEVTRLVWLALRETDFLARYDLGEGRGDDFVALLPDTGAERAMEIAERVRTSVAGWRGSKVRVTVTIGVATREPGISQSTGLIRQADDSLERARAAGRNRISS